MKPPCVICSARQTSQVQLSRDTCPSNWREGGAMAFAAEIAAT